MKLTGTKNEHFEAPELEERRTSVQVAEGRRDTASGKKGEIRQAETPLPDETVGA